MSYSNTPYDDVYRTMEIECIQLMIPLINEMFDKNYSLTEKIISLRNEHFVLQEDCEKEERITDSCIMLGDDIYHIECQSTPDGTMALRMFEYDFKIALEKSQLEKHTLKIRFPKSAVLYLRSTPSTPDQLTVIMETPGGTITYQMPVLKMQDYSLEDIFAKKLYFLIPFYLFTFEQNFGTMEEDEEQLNILKQEYISIAERLDKLVSSGEIDAYMKTTILEMIRITAEHLAKNYEKVRKGVTDVMGGKVLNYPAKNFLYEGMQKKGMICYLNATTRGMSHEDALAIADITEGEATTALSLRKEGKL